MKITGVNKKIITGCDIIIRTLLCYIIYFIQYPWDSMATPIHTILLHVATVMKKGILPIGQLSEDA